MGILSLFSGGAVDRTAAEQRRVDKELSKMTLYHFTTCPFCVKVRGALKRLGLEVEMRNINKNRAHFDELISGGGSKQVPCLRIEESNGQGEASVRWLYESDDIIRFLKTNFA